MFSKFMPSINKEGYLIIMLSIIVSCVVSAVSWNIGCIFLFFTLLCIYFFRDPVRAVPINENLILSPADGVVHSIKEVVSPIDPNENVMRVSIFLNVLNVHVNRIPISGTIKGKEYRPGKFVSATLDKSSDENERQRITIVSDSGNTVIVEQIAGLIARRIVCYPNENQTVKSGERFGIIRFGSRVNIYFSKDIKVLVAEGQTVIGGETVIANIKNTIEEVPFQLI